MPAFLPKKHGELAEALFVSKAISLGFAVSKPWGDSEPFDFIASYRRRMSRVQVRSSSCENEGCFHVHVVTHGRRFSRANIDVLVVYAMPADAWYIIPVSAFKGRHGVWVCPLKPNSQARFERYREAWHLLVPGAPKSRRRRVQSKALPPQLREK